VPGGNFGGSLVAREVDSPTSQERYRLGGDINLNVRTALTVTTQAERPRRSTRLPREGTRVWVVANQALTSFVRKVHHYTLLDLVAPCAKSPALGLECNRRLALFGSRPMATLATCHPGRMDKPSLVLVRVTIQTGPTLHLRGIDVRMLGRSLGSHLPIAEGVEKGA
jgi:hypothetical protein